MLTQNALGAERCVARPTDECRRLKCVRRPEISKKQPLSKATPTLSSRFYLQQSSMSGACGSRHNRNADQGLGCHLDMWVVFL